MLSVSVIVTSSHEPQTIGWALKAILEQNSPQIKEILVVAPDEGTLSAAKESTTENAKVKFLKDSGKGKPAALNLALRQAQGDILVLTDGDVYVAPKALSHLLRPFSDIQVGGSCGRPIPTNRRDTMFGFWSHFLTEAAHQIRLDRSRKGQFLELSGYLLAIRKSIISPVRLASPAEQGVAGEAIPPNTLADDLYLSHLIAKSGFKTVYTPDAKVLVNYPTNLSDWFKQKKRSAFEYWQNNYSSGQKMRTPSGEVFYGLKFAVTYPKNFQEIFWLKLLFWARTFLWLQIFFLKLTHSQKNLWVQVKSTK